VPDPTTHRPPLDPGRFAGLPAPWHVEVVEESGSTNADLARRARDGARPGLVLVAEHQTAGRGRLDRAWVTPARAALTFSVLLAPDEVPAARWPWLPLLTGVAVVEGVRRAAGVAAGLKWPNDVLVGDLKVAGILAERIERPGGAVAVVGVGLNVSSTAAELPVPTATSLALAGAGTTDRSTLLLAVLSALDVTYDGWRAVAGRADAGLQESYAAACTTPGRDVRVELPTGGSLRGRATGIDGDGRLLVDDGARVHALGAGDVVHVRPAAGPVHDEVR
jgi:BirA family biotin operon repressor/biotin-[acetyl-CoA-carboxylase] ligase